MKKTIAMLAGAAVLALVPSAADAVSRSSAACARQQRAVARARTRRARANAQRALRRCRQAASRRALTPTISVDATTIGTRDPIIATARNLPTPEAGTHYRMFFYSDSDDFIDCAWSQTRDWVKTSAVFMPPIDPEIEYWCTGPATVSVARVPDASPEDFSGTEIASTKITVTG